MAHQWKKAQDKGLKELPKKWYWVWYEDKRSAFDDKKWHEPDGYIPLTAISKINRQPERNDQFVVSYQEDGEKKALIYRREGRKVCRRCDYHAKPEQAFPTPASDSVPVSLQ